MNCVHHYCNSTTNHQHWRFSDLVMIIAATQFYNNFGNISALSSHHITTTFCTSAVLSWHVQKSVATTLIESEIEQKYTGRFEYFGKKTWCSGPLFVPSVGGYGRKIATHSPLITSLILSSNLVSPLEQNGRKHADEKIEEYFLWMQTLELWIKFDWTVLYKCLWKTGQHYSIGKKKHDLK